MTTPGQVSIAGETISGVRITVGAMTMDTVPDGITWEDLTTLERKVRIRFSGEAVLTATPRVNSKYDAETGDETGDIMGELVFKPIREGFKITGVQTPADRQAAWEAEHTG